MIDKKKVIKEIQSWIFTIVIALCIVAVCNSKVFAKVQVDGASMENTLFNEEHLIIDKLSYNFTEPKRGDIIIFLNAEERGNIIDDTIMLMEDIKSTLSKEKSKHKRYVKRVIGIPGDIIDIKEGYVYVNSKNIEEPYAKTLTDSGSINLPITVGENELFVLGDNRDKSKDGRELGTIDYKQVEGKVIFRLYPFDVMGTVK